MGVRRVPVERIEKAIDLCARKIGAVHERLEGLYRLLPEDGPDDALAYALHGSVGCLLLDHIEEAAKTLSKMLAEVRDAKARGWKGELEWLEDSPELQASESGSQAE